MSLARRFIIVVVCALAAPLTAPTHRARAFDGASERVATDPLSGIAIFGYDPVGYFLNGRPLAGSRSYEWTYASVVWRFASEANREAFRRSPDVFAPAYGGYDAEGISRGVVATPDPTVFAILDDRLFLFRSEEARERFDTQDGVSQADAVWPKVAEGLRP